MSVKYSEEYKLLKEKLLEERKEKNRRETLLRIHKKIEGMTPEQLEEYRKEKRDYQAKLYIKKKEDGTISKIKEYQKNYYQRTKK
jgi:hypothetical protein